LKKNYRNHIQEFLHYQHKKKIIKLNPRKKIKLANWALSSFESEYQEVQINKINIKLVTLEGKKVITFNLDKQNVSKEDNNTSKKER